MAKLQHRLREFLHRLPHTKISEDLLCATQDSIELVSAVEHFNDLAHTGLGNATTSEDVGGMVGNFMRRLGSERFEQTNGTTQVGSLLGICHVAHLVGN